MFHPFYVKNEDGTGQWKAASNLEAGDELLTEDGKKVFVSEVRVEKLEEEITVYNLELDEVHTYYVALGVLVHNMCATNDKKKDDTTDSNKYKKASLWERLTKRKPNVNELHENPLDEFSNPKIGPCNSAVAKYIKEINETGKLSSPIEVQMLSSGGYEIVNGHHRWLAAIKTGLELVPIIIKNYEN